MDPRKVEQFEKWDPLEYLQTPEDVALYLEDMFENGDPQCITAALGTVARSRGMTEIARMSGVSREALYRALSETGDPRLSTLTNVLKALGLRLACVPDGRAA